MRRRCHTRTVFFGLVSLVPFGLVLACGESKPPTAPTTESHAATTAGHPGASGATGAITRGPTSLDFDPSGKGDPMSLFWDDVASTLYIADNRENQLWQWDDKSGFAKLAALPDDPAATASGKTELGQIVRLDDGTLVVPRFGFGQRGAIAYVNPKTHASGTVPDASLTHCRIGLTRRGARGSADNGMFGTYFESSHGSGGAGAVTKVSLTSETDYATGFQKPVAVLVHDGKLIVSDQSAGILYALPLEGAAAPYPVYAKVPSPDTLTEGPNGSLITGQFRPSADGGSVQIRQIFADGRIKVVAPQMELTKPKGVAYDKTNRRLFVADSNGTAVRTIKIIPLE